ncbi:hypothetical protein AAC387_Pa03g3543 [Persea americana]
MADDPRFICKRTVVSTKEVKPGKICPLSVLDHSMELNRIRIVIYYNYLKKFSDGEVTIKMRESLAELLTSFPMVTGRLKRSPEGQWTIKCNDAGVRMVEATAKGSVEEWLERVDRERELQLASWEDMFHNPYFWSTFYVQLTEFEGGGLAIGLSCTHLVADAAAATMLLKAWAETTLLGKMLSPPYFHPLPTTKTRSISPNPHLIPHYQSSFSLSFNNPIPTSNTPNMATLTLSFSQHMVQRCMADARSSDPFASLAALLWVAICGVKDKSKQGVLLDMSLCLDMRKVLGLSKAFFGNAMVFDKVSGDGLKERDLVEAAKVISDGVSKMGNEGVVMGLIEWLQSEKMSHEHNLPVLSGPGLVCANWEGLCPYEAKFEVGVEPIRASYYLESVFGEGHLLILPAPKGEGPLGRAVMVTLPDDQALELCEDPLIHSYSPTILMGPKTTPVRDVNSH